MTKKEAKRQACAAAAVILDDGGHENLWLEQDRKGRPLSEGDQRRMREAFDELVDELRRRGKGPEAVRG